MPSKSVLPGESPRGEGSAAESAATDQSSAFVRMYQANFKATFRACFVICRDFGLAEEATQEAFARALERWWRLHDKPWVAGWVARTAINFTRRSLQRQPLQNSGQQDDPDLAFDLDLQRGISALPRRQQQAFVLRYVFDLSLRDTAASMRCSEGAAKSHLSRARASISEYLSGGEDERP